MNAAASPTGLLAALNPASAVRRRFQRWWQARLRSSDSYTLHQRNVYILPTRPGLMLAATLLVLLIASINYQLNLGYLLTFLLAGSAMASMQVCHATLRGITLHLIAPSPLFMGSTALIDINLHSPGKRPRHGIGLSVLGARHWVWTDVPAQGQSQVQVAWAPTRRGLNDLPLLTAETRFPLGTFRVWTVWRPAAQVLVYPRPEQHAPPLPPGQPRAVGTSSRSNAGSGEFDGVRPYRRGDPRKAIVWKKAAKSLASGAGELVSRDDHRPQAYELWLDYGQTGSLDREARLSRLCAWVLKADAMGLRYGLRLPQRDIAPASGEAQRRQCLEALALC